MAKRAKKQNSYVKISDCINLERKTPSEIINQIMDLFKDDISVLEVYNVRAKVKKTDTNEANLELFALSENLCCLVGVFTTQITKEEAVWIIEGEDPELETRDLFFAVKSVPKEFVKEEKLKKKKQEKSINETSPTSIETTTQPLRTSKTTIENVGDQTTESISLETSSLENSSVDSSESASSSTSS